MPHITEHVPRFKSIEQSSSLCPTFGASPAKGTDRSGLKSIALVSSSKGIDNLSFSLQTDDNFYRSFRTP